ncbi:ATP-binding protein [Cupriavidus metallidurans]|mgnify:CR=1 FL=1|uniref:histidine kinase n=1 Tax=Cupriavidus metallidurans (strain ATCC 43123 / DSM 2839 / NBRC 102507 / CH34) TaxID=266264 RepID=Q1LGH6_CUPMC|nr:ATP-binding protein [Cupriavidus metallidurans]ABF10750.1 periplasmic sensor signal transduction histidine kinase [Cupriavidus metallidurans CH34]QGS31785.1 HAMP domain-containing protein [Cupriavidus metallidurans]
MRIGLPRSLLARNIALLVALVAFTQVCSLMVLLHFAQRPRVERAATVFAHYVSMLDGVMAAMPAEEARVAVARLGGQTDAPAVDDVMEARALHPFRTWQRDVFMDELHKALPPDMPVQWQDAGDNERLWIRIRAAGMPTWVALPMTADAQASGITAAIALSAALGLLAALTGYLIQRHINRPLQDLARAALHVSAGETPAPLPTDGPTEISQVSSAFNRMTEALQQTEKTRALMLAGISHDIRTPLTKLRLAMAMALPRGTDDAFVGSVEGYLDRIDTILQQFMDYAGSGEREAPQPGDLNALVRQLASDFAGLGHEFELDLGDLPPVSYRPTSMLRLLMNLMQNAINYGRTGLMVRTWKEGGAAHVAVCDRGIGISVAELEQLRAPFSRGDNARGHSGGTGLGLAIVERIARLHGGSLAFRPREGGGLEVVVSLPV